MRICCVRSVHPAGTGRQQEAQISRYGGIVVTRGLVLGTIVTVFRLAEPVDGGDAVAAVVGVVVPGFVVPAGVDGGATSSSDVQRMLVKVMNNS